METFSIDHRILGEEEAIDLNIKNNNIYPAEDIKVEREFYSIYELKRKYDKKNQIILDSDFQRNLVWSNRQKSELIESVLMGLPLPIIYLNEDKNGKLIVVDGRQRLTTFFEFMDNKFKLTSLSILKSISGKYFKELEFSSQSKLEDFQLIMQVIKPPTSDRIKFDIFDRVNRGGTVLNNQEMRNALYQGKATRLLKELAESNEFKKAVSFSVSSTRMKDRYIILRFLSFYLWRKKMLLDDDNKLIQYKSDIDDFLGKAMECINNFDDKSILELKKNFLSAMNNSFMCLGENAFRLNNVNKRKSPINMVAFEAISYLMANITKIDDIKIAILKEKCKELLQNKEFKQSIEEYRDAYNKVETRFSLIEKIISEVQ